MDLVGSDSAGDAIWAELAKAERTAGQEAKHGRRVEVWVTVSGRLNASKRRSPIGPCDRMVSSGFGHLGSFPAQIVAESFKDVQVIPRPDSPYDYSHIYRGAAQNHPVTASDAAAGRTGPQSAAMGAIL